ncbi:MAG: hypothetical protein WAM91_17760 [Candidatus Acidiferrales bacterium]
MIIVRGKVAQGCKHFTARLNQPKFCEAYRKATGEDLHKGTLDVKVDRCIPIKEHFRMRGKDFDHPHEDFLFEVCRINSIWAYRLRPYNLCKGDGGHGDNILEIACSQEIPHDPTGNKEVEIVLLRDDLAP